MVHGLNYFQYYRSLFYYFRKLIEYRDSAKAQEMAYWRNEIKFNSKLFLQEDLYRRGPDIKFTLDLVKSSFNVTGRDIKVLEIGPGPRSLLRKGYEEETYDLVGVDPLADDYKKELDGGPFLRFGFGEEVGAMFNPNSFHVVYASNALDHCKDSHKVVTGVFRVLKTKGIFIVCGNEREGSRSHWMGYHKHDLWIEGENLLHSDEKGCVSTLIGENFSLINKRDMIYDWQGNKIKWFLGIWQKQLSSI